MVDNHSTPWAGATSMHALEVLGAQVWVFSEFCAADGVVSRSVKKRCHQGGLSWQRPFDNPLGGPVRRQKARRPGT